jgi:succinate dehydrogenase / fumarate reductase, cytochrome b subunit
MAEIAIKKKRPKNLDLATIRQPLPAVLSILHRISGAILFILLPVLLCLFQQSLASPEGYAAVKVLAGGFVFKILALGVLWMFMHHFCAGIRYLLLDLHMGVDLQSARFSSKVVFAVSIVLTLIVGAKVLL